MSRRAAKGHEGACFVTGKASSGAARRTEVAP